MDDMAATTLRLWGRHVAGQTRPWLAVGRRPLGPRAALSTTRVLAAPEVGADGAATPGVGEVVPTAQETLAAVGTSELAALGLGTAYTPVSLIENALDALHTATGLPWAGTIVVATVGVRVLLLPLVFRTMRNSARLHNIRPEMEEYTARMNAYTRQGDKASAQTMQLKLQELFITNKTHPLSTLLFPLVQMPVFVSFFFALRAMAAAPVASMQSQGLAWFTDLTVPDPLYILPVVNSALLLASIELGSEGNVASDQTRAIKMAFRVLSVVMIPLTASFPTALFTYWVTSSVFSLSQLLLLRIPGLKARLGIPELRVVPKSTVPRQGFWETFKATAEAARKNAEAEAERRQEQERRTQAAAAGPPPTLANKPPAKKAAP